MCLDDIISPAFVIYGLINIVTGVVVKNFASYKIISLLLVASFLVCLVSFPVFAGKQDYTGSDLPSCEEKSRSHERDPQGISPIPAVSLEYTVVSNAISGGFGNNAKSREIASLSSNFACEKQVITQSTVLGISNVLKYFQILQHHIARLKAG